MKYVKKTWKKILSSVCAVVLLVQTVISSPSMFVQAADAGELSGAITAATYSATYAQAEDEAQAQATALKQVQAVVDETTSTTGTYPVSISGTPSLNLTAAGGTYSFAVTVDLGNSQSMEVSELSMSIAARPKRVEMVFDSAASTAVGSNVDNIYSAGSKEVTFPDETVSGGKKYMRTVIKPNASGWTDCSYTCFLYDAGQSNLDLDAYPYMKISYRRNVSSTMTNERSVISFTNGDNKSGTRYLDLYKISSDETPYWTSSVIDMREKNGDDKEDWTGTCGQYNLSIGLSKYGSLERTVDVEYIAFFGSKEEADAYPVSVTVYEDMQKLAAANENGTFTCKAGEASDANAAKAVLGKKIEELALSNTYTVSDGDYVAPTDTTEGSYETTVVFDEDTKIYVKLTIEKKIAAVVWSFNRSSMAERLQTGSSNAKFTYEKGLVKVTTVNKEVDDGFMLDMTLDANEQYDTSKLNYAKVKYKLTGGANAKLQFYEMMETDASSLFYWGFQGNTETSDGDWVTMILNLSVTEKGKDAVSIHNETDNTDSTAQYIEVADTPITEGTVKRIRLNLARQSGLDRTAEVEYLALFSTLEEAQAFNGTGEADIAAAKEKLNAVQVINYGDGNTPVKAKAAIVSTIENCGLGAEIGEVTDYTKPTTTSNGSITVSVTLYSGQVSETIPVTASIHAKPSAPIMWRFNDVSMLNGLDPQSATLKIEDNVLKMTSTDPINADGFYFMADTAKLGEQFYLQDYPYIQIKYKRNIASVAQIYFYSDALTGNPSLGSGLGYGPQNDTWYTTTIDTSAKNIGDISTYNYNHATGEWENKVRDRSNGAVTSDFVGLSTKFRFNFGRWKYLDRTAEIEYIAFFPTLEDANAYAGSEAQEQERLISNAKVALADYSLPTVSYYDGCEKDYAAETAEDLLQSQVGDEVVVKVGESATDTHSVPILGTTDGEYEFTASIYDKKDNKLYETEQYAMTISHEADTAPVVFSFANPSFVGKRVVTGDTTVATAENYKKMSLAATSGTAEFSLALNRSEKFHMSGLSYIALQASDENLTLLLNEKELSLGNIPSGTKVVINGSTGEIYLDGVQQGTSLSIGELERITSLGVKAGDADAEVTYIGFFATLEEAQNYAGESTVLNNAVSSLNSESLSCAYSDAKTEPYALLYVGGKIKETIGEDASVVKTTKKVFTPASKNGTGSITVTALLSAGSESDTHYQEVEVTMTIGKQPDGPIVWSFAGNAPEGVTVGTGARAWNSTQSYTANALKIQSKTPTTEDGVGFKVTPASGFYLQDYPYIKIKMKGSAESSNTGRDLIYITTDEAAEHFAQFNFFSLAKGVSASAIIDTTTDLITVCDLEKNAQKSNTTLSGQLTWHGQLRQMEFVFGRDIRVNKTMEVEYVAFFSTREEAESYNWDYCYDGYTFNGVEYAESMATVSEAPKTIEAGIRIPNGTTSAMTIASNAQFSLETTADGYVKFVYGSEDVLTSTEVNVYDGMWHHVAVTLENEKAVLYVDNTLVATSENFELSGYTASSVQVAKGNEKGLKGTVYYVRLFSSAKTQIELSKYAFSQVCDDTDVLAGWFMDELSSDKQFADVCEANPLKLTDNYGKDGHEFLGNDYIKTTKKLTAVPHTIEFWMKAGEESATGTYTILSNKSATNTKHTTVALENGKLRFYSQNNQGYYESDLQLSLTDGIWKHIAITFDSSVVKVYINGENKFSNTWNLGTNSYAQSNYYIGASLEDTKTPYKGSLSDVRIWSTVRTAEEIKNNMKEYVDGSSTGLLASWRLDTQDKLVYKDYSSNKNDGKLYSDGWYKLENITGAYTIAQVGDTQDYFVETANVAAQPMKMLEFYEGVAKNIDRFNLVHFMHAGDVTQYNTPTEWNYSRQAYDYIAGKLQYTIAIGNHDYPTPSSGIGAEYRDAEHYNAAFPLSTIKNEANVTTEYSAGKFAYGTYGGAYKENASENVYTYLTVGDVEYIIFAIEFGPSDDVLNWVSSVLNATENQSKQAIITTHCYFSQWGDLTVYDAQNCGDDFKETANDGVDIWEELLSKHDNISLITAGHSQNSQLVYKVSETEKSTDVVQLLADHSAAAKAFPSQEGLMLMMAFNEDGTEMHTYYYSPFYDAFYDTDNEVTFEIKNKATDSTAPKIKVKYYDDISKYRTEGNYTAPKCEYAGYIFSGWYTDANCTNALAATTQKGQAYAKFVKEDILSVKAQVGVDENGKIPMDLASIRFVTTVDSLKYQEVAFMVSIQNGTAYTEPKSTATDENSRLVYKNLYALDDSGNTITYAPSVFNSSSKYFKAWTLEDVPASAYSTKIKVTPYWITLDGTKVLGRTSIKTIQSFVNRINNKAVETTPLIQD